MTRLLLFLFACVAAHASQLTIPWTYRSADIPVPTSFVVERRDPKATAFVVKATVPGTTRQYTDTTLKNNTVYVYRVRAENKTSTGTVYGDYSNVVEVKTNPKPNR